MSAVDKTKTYGQTVVFDTDTPSTDFLVTGLTIIAAGTSMPELATSVVAARRGQADIALGNVLDGEHAVAVDARAPRLDAAAGGGGFGGHRRSLLV